MLQFDGKIQVFTQKSRSHFRVLFHTVRHSFYPTAPHCVKKILSNQFFNKTVTFTKFLPKMRESKFPEFPHCAMGGATANVLSKGFLSHGTKSFAKWLCKNDLLRYLANNTEIQYYFTFGCVGIQWFCIPAKSHAIIYFVTFTTQYCMNEIHSCLQENLR